MRFGRNEFIQYNVAPVGSNSIVVLFIKKTFVGNCVNSSWTWRSREGGCLFAYCRPWRKPNHGLTPQAGKLFGTSDAIKMHEGVRNVVILRCVLLH